MRQIYLAATGQNRGKTTAALGLLEGFLRRGLTTGFLKPVGQRTVIEDGESADEDAVLVREVFDEVAEVQIPSEVHERLVAWRARFGLAIDNALNFLNNPDGIQGHNFATQVAHVEERRVLQGRLTLVRYNNEPQFFVADASVFLSLVADVMERLGPYLEPEAIEAETISRLRDAVQLIERKTTSTRT